jgi:hypothetical protein
MVLMFWLHWTMEHGDDDEAPAGMAQACAPAHWEGGVRPTTSETVGGGAVACMTTEHPVLFLGPRGPLVCSCGMAVWGCRVYSAVYSASILLLLHVV